MKLFIKNIFNFGFAADTPRGLLVPVVHDVDQKSIVQISRGIKELSDKARSASISLEEMKGATITITNMGSIAGEWASPIINPPEVCILGMYRMFDKPVWKNNGSFRPEKTMNFSVTCDHRLIDGAAAARFIHAVYRTSVQPFSHSYRKLILKISDRLGSEKLLKQQLNDFNE